MIRFEIEVLEPDLVSLSGWLKLPDGSGDNIDLFIKSFNENESSFLERACNWAKYNCAELSAESVSAHANEKGDGFTAAVEISHIDICGAAKALGVPSPIAVIAAHISENGLTSAMNTLMKLNRGIISAEAVRQLRKRGMEAHAVYGSICSEKTQITGVT